MDTELINNIKTFDGKTDRGSTLAVASIEHLVVHSLVEPQVPHSDSVLTGWGTAMASVAPNWHWSAHDLVRIQQKNALPTHWCKKRAWHCKVANDVSSEAHPSKRSWEQEWSDDVREDHGEVRSGADVGRREAPRHVLPLAPLGNPPIVEDAE